MTTEKLTLYIGGTCRFSLKVVDYLKQHPMEIEIKDVWADDVAKQEMLALTQGSTQVPCLKIGEQYMHESLDIIERLKELQHGS